MAQTVMHNQSYSKARATNNPLDEFAIYDIKSP